MFLTHVKHAVVICALILLGNTCAFAQYPFKKTYPISSCDATGTLFTSTCDGGMLLLCNMTAPMTTLSFITVIKTDSAGNVQWTKSFGPVGGWPKNVHQTSDSGYVFCYADTNASQLGYRLIKLDHTGTLVFSQYAPLASGWSIPYSGLVSMIRNDGGFYVGNYVLNNATQKYAWHVCSFDSAGSLVWSEGYHYQNYIPLLSAIDTCSNGDLVMFGHVYDPPTQVLNSVVTRVHSNGSLVWTRYYFSSAGLRSWSVETKGDAIYMLSSAFISGNNQLILLKLDSVGNAQWSQSYAIAGISPQYLAVKCVENGNIAMTGISNADSYFLKTDSAGTILSARKFPYMHLNEMDTLSGTGYIFSGITMVTDYSLLMTTDYAGVGCTDTSAIFTSSPFPVDTSTFYGPVIIPGKDTAVSLAIVPFSVIVNDICNATGVENSDSFFSPVLFPNPASQIVQINGNQPIGRVELIDAQGRTVLTQQNAGINAMLDVSGLAEGLYCVRVYSGSQVSTQKIIIQRN